MLLVTFSGLDGSGKSTHVVLTADHLTRKGYRVYTLETARVSTGGLLVLVREAWKCLAERLKGTRVRVPSARPQAQTLGEARSASRGWRQQAVLTARWIVYPLDCLALRIWVRCLSILGYSAVVCDRYVYDQIVNLPDPDCLLRRLMSRLSPAPDHAFLMDVSPETARQRREEHEAGYYVTRHAGYKQLIGLRCGLRVIPSTTIEETQRCLERTLDGSTANMLSAAACTTP